MIKWAFKNTKTEIIIMDLQLRITNLNSIMKLYHLKKQKGLTKKKRLQNRLEHKTARNAIKKLKEVKTKAAFKAQEIYAKSIGAKGKILSTGLTGQSIGLLALNEERRQGFALAEQDATVRSAEMAMGTSMEGTRLKALSNINTIASRLDPPVMAPQLSPQPIGIGKDLGLGIPSYNWGTA